MQNLIKKVTATSTATLLLGAALIATAAVAPVTTALAQAKQSNSAKLAKPLKEANDDIKAKKYADAVAKLKDAEGIAGNAILGCGNEDAQAHVELLAHDHMAERQSGRRATHVLLHQQHPARRLQIEAARIKADTLADERDGCSALTPPCAPSP